MNNNSVRKAKSVFNYVYNMVSQRYKIITDIDQELWSISEDAFPKSSYFFFNSHLKIDDESGDCVLIKVKKPDDFPCPEPPEEIKAWLKAGWEKSSSEVTYLETLKKDSKHIEGSSIETIERFEENELRIKVYDEWIHSRNEWIENQKSRELFIELYKLYKEIERESETKELVIGNGIIHTVKNDEIKYPIFLKRVRFDFNANTNEISILDADVNAEINTAILQKIEDIDYKAIQQAIDELEKNEYHPFDEDDTPEFLSRFTNSISAESRFVREPEFESLQSNDNIIIEWKRVFMMRRKLDGTLKAIEGILKTIENTEFVPNHILELIGEGSVNPPVEYKEIEIEESLARACGESRDILLAKEANKEQLEIAERIGNYNAVLVQGPPGTGKTHTIANLIGDLLAQGKSVLVTSQKRKALSVLKEKVPKEIQPLCVSVLDDTNRDMIKSIEGISEYSTAHSIYDLQEEIALKGKKRDDVIKKLAETRHKIYQMRYKENKTVVYNGQSYSPIEMGKWVREHENDYSKYIPGKIELGALFPLTKKELNELYESNKSISVEESMAIAIGLPELSEFWNPEEFGALLEKKELYDRACNELSKYIGAKLYTEWESGTIKYYDESQEYTIFDINNQQKTMINVPFAIAEKICADWQIQAAIDGKRGKGYKQRWLTLKDEIDNINEFSESVAEKFLGNKIECDRCDDLQGMVNKLQHLKDHFETKGKVSKIDMLIHKDFSDVLSAISINGTSILSSNDCQVAIDYIKLLIMRTRLHHSWDDLITGEGAISYRELGFRPEESGKKIIGNLEFFLNWYDAVYNAAIIESELIGFEAGKLFKRLDDIDAKKQFQYNLQQIEKVVPLVNVIARYFRELRKEIRRADNLLSLYEKSISEIMMALDPLLDSIKAWDCALYKEAYINFKSLYRKKQIYNTRKSLVEKVQKVAPDWADAIINRRDIHGEELYPLNIEEAWQWKQFSAILTEMFNESYSELQEKSVILSAKLHQLTAELAAARAWYHLLCRTENHPEMRSALNGWKLTIGKIGKGTGKKAVRFKNEARQLMAQCQKAVPAWIMPLNKALESFDAMSTRFDVLIIDEASQSDLSALSILYMAKKVIIVGDDKQVSPMAVGIEDAVTMSLMDMYLEEDIPNKHLYIPDTSLYDLAGTVYQPLMLREHFRCVPEIIAYSNKLSYDFKIKPLRDGSSSKLIPPVVPYRVNGGLRNGKMKINSAEAKTIVALMLACIEQPEYNNQTFGAISLLGSDQARLIEQEVFKHIPLKIAEESQILCGDASNFQGDERDVIFLSMVDSNEAEGPMRLLGEGKGQSTKQRYNVAVSRAKNQLWVIHSLDPDNDLKPGDIRKGLLDFAENPQLVMEEGRLIKEKADSPFEEAVASSLVAAGYNIEQQHQVGSYRIDMVVYCGKKCVAIECDGEAYHSGEDKVREDMERQTILERLGWRFIRIRGSEYYRNPTNAMERVFKELEKKKIFPESIEKERVPDYVDTDLLLRVKNRARDLLKEWQNDSEMTEDVSEKIQESGSIEGGSIEKNNQSNYLKSEKLRNEKKLDDRIRQINLIDWMAESKGNPTENNIPKVRKNKQKEIKKSSNNRAKKDLDKSLDKSYENFLNKIKDSGFEYVDNYKKSGLIWIILPEDRAEEKKGEIEKLIQAEGYKSGFERRGALATNGKAAYHISLK